LGGCASDLASATHTLDSGQKNSTTIICPNLKKKSRQRRKKVASASGEECITSFGERGKHKLSGGSRGRAQHASDYNDRVPEKPRAETDPIGEGRHCKRSWLTNHQKRGSLYTIGSCRGKFVEKANGRRKIPGIFGVREKKKKKGFPLSEAQDSTSQWIKKKGSSGVLDSTTEMSS